MAIDDYSLGQSRNADLSSDPQMRQLTAWPWPRAIYGTLLDRLFAAGAKAVAIDLLFDSPSSHGAADDQSLARALRRYRHRVVLGAQVLENSGLMAGVSLSQAVPALGSEALSGLLNAQPDADGFIRSRPSRYSEQLHLEGLANTPPGLALQLIRSSGLMPEPEHPRTGPQEPLLLNYGPPGTIPTVPIWEVLDSLTYQRLVSQGRFKNAVVLVGPTAAVMQDLHPSAFSGGLGMPGVELHATEVANRLEGQALYLLPLPWWSWVMLFTVLVVLGIAAKRIDKPLQRLGVFVLLAVCCGLIGLGLLNVWGLGVRLMGFAVLTFLTGVVSTAEATVQLQLLRLKLRQTLDRYLSPAVASWIADKPETVVNALGGEASEVVIMISDVRGFTERTRQMSDAGRAADLVKQLNSYFTEVVEEVHFHGGTVDKFIGDAVLVVFGAPLNRGFKVEVESALKASIGLHRRLGKLNQSWEAEGRDPWQHVVALNFGTVISGNIGSISRMEYTVIGDAVNTCSRLEAVAKQLNRTTVLSEAVAKRAGDDWQLEDLGPQEIRGVGLVSVYSLSQPEELG